MCLAAWSTQQNKRFPLVLASNRDEFFARPTAPLNWWRASEDAVEILSGRDLEAGGSWLGVTRRGRLALVTNVREPDRFITDALSRGALVIEGVTRDVIDVAWLDEITHAPRNGFNFLTADLFTGDCVWATNRTPLYRRFGAGLYGLSNALLDTPWPKVVSLKEKLAELLSSADTNVDADADRMAEQLFSALSDPQIAADTALPKTGVPLERERLLSPAFIRITDTGKPEAIYGTRCSTVVIAEQVGDTQIAGKAVRKIVRVYERVYDARGQVSGNTVMQFEVE